jgi:polyisoprenyl-phosphate glycosyltransferase
MTKKLISIVIPCYNEEANIVPLCNAITEIMNSQLQQYDYEIIISDNNSEDRTREYLRELAAGDRRIKVLLNDNNYRGGSLRNAILHSKGDVTILMFADFQDPPELIPQYVSYWEEGYKVIPAVRVASNESKTKTLCRRVFYWLLEKSSGLNIIHNYNGTGCYDREFMDLCKQYMSHDWNMRIFVARYGVAIKEMRFKQPARRSGTSSNSFFSLVEQASDFIMMYLNRKLPVVVALISVLGIGFAALLWLYYLIMKLTYWNSFEAGIAPLLLLLLIQMFAQNTLFALILVMLLSLDRQAGGEGMELNNLCNKKGQLPAYVGLFLKVSNFIERNYRLMPVVGGIGIFGTLVVVVASILFKMVHWTNYVLGITPAVLIVCFLLGTLILWGGIIRYYLMRVSFLLREAPLAVVAEKLNFD